MTTEQLNEMEDYQLALNIDDAEVWAVQEYGYYCNEKIIYDNEMPLSFAEWYKIGIATRITETN